MRALWFKVLRQLHGSASPLPLRKGRSKARCERSFRPRVEILEDRSLLSGSTFLVTTLTDLSTSVPGQLSLRQAVDAADQWAAANPGGTATVTLEKAGTYKLTVPNTAPADTTTDLYITGNMTIQPASTGSFIIDGNGTGRVLNIAPSSGGVKVTVEGVTLQDGRVTGNGGAISMTGTGGSLTLSKVTIQKNRAVQDGGGVFVDAANSLTLSTDTFSQNLADANGAAVADEGTDAVTLALSVTGTKFTGNIAANNGGGIYVLAHTFQALAGGATISGSTFTGNVAGDNSTTGGDGGGLYASLNTAATNTTTMTIGTSTFTSNYAVGNPSGYDDGTGAGGAEADGFSSLTVNGTTFTKNTGVVGGGLLANGTGSGSASITNSTFSSNTAANNAGAH